MENFQKIITQMPIIAIIRGVLPNEVVEIGKSLIDAGIRIVEVPLNSPNPFDSINRLCQAYPDCIIGAGTVLNISDVRKVKEAGGKIIVSPNINAEVIKETIALDMISVPGFQTATEALIATGAGAKYLKLFPANSMAMGHIKSIKAVLPKECRILAVGGAGPQNMDEWLDAGADGFGIGSELYKPGSSASDVKIKAIKCVTAFENCRK